MNFSLALLLVGSKWFRAQHIPGVPASLTRSPPVGGPPADRNQTTTRQIYPMRNTNGKPRLDRRPIIR